MKNSVGRPPPPPKKKQQIFRIFRVPFDYPEHSLQETVLPKPMVAMESRDSGGVPFASLDSPDQAFGRYRPLKRVEKLSRDYH